MPAPAGIRPIGIDLFAGVGGMSLGFEQAGFDIVASVEYDPVHAAVHEFNFPNTTTLCADVTKLTAEDLLEAARAGFIAHGRSQSEWNPQEIDVIFGGPPCQGFSTIGKRDVSDHRNSLVNKFAEIIGAVRPRYFVMENVPGMAAGGHAGILARLMAKFQKHGYNLAVEVESVRRKAILCAADFGVPQDRRRLILIGAREGLPVPSYPTPAVRPAPKRLGERRKAEARNLFLSSGPTVGEAILDLPDLDEFEELLICDEVWLNEKNFALMTERSSEYVRHLRGALVDNEDLSHPRQWNPRQMTSSMRTVHSVESITRFKGTPPGSTEAISRFYRLDPEGLCNTLRAGTGSERGAYTSPRPLHPTLPRVLSVREAARLHSFPDWFRLHRTKWNGFRSIGNAVPPLLGRAIGQSIVRALGVHPTKPTVALSLGDPSLLSLNRLQAAAHFGVDQRHIPQVRKRLLQA